MGLIVRHEAFPFAKACHGKEGVKSIEGGGEGNVLVNIECTTYGIDCHPCQPLLKVFACEHPQGNNAQGGNETVAKGDTAVGEAKQDEVDAYPCCAESQ